MNLIRRIEESDDLLSNEHAEKYVKTLLFCEKNHHQRWCFYCLLMDPIFHSSQYSGCTSGKELRPARSPIKSSNLLNKEKPTGTSALKAYFLSMPAKQHAVNSPQKKTSWSEECKFPNMCFFFPLLVIYSSIDFLSLKGNMERRKLIMMPDTNSYDERWYHGQVTDPL